MPKILKTLKGVAMFATLALFPVVGVAWWIVSAHNRKMRSNGKPTIFQSLKEEFRDYVGRRDELKRQRAQNPYFNGERRSWNLDSVHPAMRPTVGPGDPEVQKFSVDGMKDVVVARARGFSGGMAKPEVDFAFTVKDPRAAERLHSLVNGKEFAEKYGPNAGSFRYDSASDSYEFRFRDPSAAVEMVRKAYPRETVDVEMNRDVTKQYVVRGCSSFEEAARRVGEAGASMQPANVYSVTGVTVGGVTDVTRDGSRLSPDSVEAGTYVVDVTENSRCGGKMLHAGEIDEAAVARARFRLAAEAAGCPVVDAEPGTEIASRPGAEPVVSDGLAGGTAARHIEVEGRRIPVLDAEKAAGMLVSPVYAVRVHGVDELRNLSSRGGILPGDTVGLSMTSDDGPATYNVTVGSTPDLLKKLTPASRADEEARTRYAGILTEEEISSTLVADRLRSEGWSVARSESSVNLSEMYIDGVPAEEVRDRLSNGRLPALSNDAQMKAWLEDAAHIKSVTCSVDAKERMMTVTVQVDNVVTTEKTKLTDDDLRSLTKRGKIDKAELKDMIMQEHPDFFRTYSDGKGNPVVKDPMKSFLSGQKPEYVMASAKRGEMEAQKTQKAQIRQPKPKTKKHAGVKI